MRGGNQSAQRCLFPTSGSEEFVMSQPFSLLSVAILLAFASTVQGRTPLQATPAPESAPTPPAVAPNTPNPVKPTAASQAKAKSLYGIDCAVCHADNGNGQSDLAKSMNLTLPDFTKPATLANMEDWQLFDIVRAGKGTMPPEEMGRASNTEVWNLIFYLRSLSKQ
jgi:mono/diheme cytochrome c family protein